MTKTQADVYYVRDQYGSWGYFFVHTNGIFTAYTDYGTYAHGWPGFARGDGVDIKSFLMRVRPDSYLLGKIARKDEFDEKATSKAFTEQVLWDRRAGGLTKERARELYDEIQEMDANELVGWGMDQRDLSPDCWEWAVYDYPAGAKCFVERLWPLFIEQLKAERGADHA